MEQTGANRATGAQATGAGATAMQVGAGQTVVKPAVFDGALANPLCGFSVSDRSPHEWATLTRTYVAWNMIENSESDDIDTIKFYCDGLWAGVEASGVKVIPRVYLHWPPDKNYWPSDMEVGDFSSPQFEARVLRLIGRLGELWDNDARVGFVQMGIIGKWGEQHSPAPSPRMQKLLGDAFKAAFKKKKVQVRYPKDFRDYTYGYYWDSWAHPDDLKSSGAGLEKLGDRWKIAVYGGETAYDWGNFRVVGDNPTDTVADPIHRAYLIDSIRKYHGTYLGWVAGYDETNPAARVGAAEVQAAMGYRFCVDEATYPTRVEPGQPLGISFTVRNLGSAPFYYNWPIELSLLDKKTGKAVWATQLKTASTSTWMPGDGWSTATQSYQTPAATNTVSESANLPKSLKAGDYVLALSIIDPWAKPALPSIKFANADCTATGRLALGIIGVGKAPATAGVPKGLLVDPSTLRPVYSTYLSW